MKTQFYSDFLLESYVSGDLADEQRKTLETVLENDALLQERVQSILNSNAAFLSRHPAAGAWTEVERRLKLETDPKELNRSIPRFSKLVLSLGGALCALALFALIPSTNQSVPDNGFRTKGALPDLEIFYVNDVDKAQALEPEALVSQGMRLQVSIHNSLNLHAFVLSVDGRGALTKHFPRDHESALITTNTHLLGASYTLDDAPDYETFILVTSDSRLTTDSFAPQLQGDTTPETLVSRIRAHCPSCRVVMHQLRK